MPVVSSEQPSAALSSISVQPPQAVIPESTEQEAISSDVLVRPIEPQTAPSAPTPPAKVQAAETLASRRWPTIVVVSLLLLIGVVWAGMRLIRPGPRQPAAKTISPAPAPKGDPIEGQQRDMLNAAGPLIAANDLDGARKKLQAGAALGGSLTPEIQRRISAIDESVKDPNLRQLRRREEGLWQQALKRVTEGQFIEARKELGQILALHTGGVHREDAQTYLDKVIPQRIQESDLSAQAHLDMSQGEFQSARFVAEQLKQSGSDSAPLLAEIDHKERDRLTQLQDQYNQLKGRDDDAAVQKLKALQQKFQAMAGDGGPQSSDALNYANGVPGAIMEVQTRMQRKNAGKPAPAPPTSASIAAKAAVRAVIQRYVQAFEKRDADTLTKIWPTVGPNYASYKSAFEAASSIRMQLNVRSLDVSTDGATAIVEARVSQDYTSKDTSETKSSKHSVTFELDKVEADWIITDIQETELPEN